MKISRVHIENYRSIKSLDFSPNNYCALIGENNGKVITAQDVANYADTIHYEIMCNITERVPRIYKQQVKEYLNYNVRRGNFYD